MRIFRGMGFFDSWGNPPDGDTGSAVAFQRIADAHHVLLDPEKRKAFDEGKGNPLGSQHPTILILREIKSFSKRGLFLLFLFGIRIIPFFQETLKSSFIILNPNHPSLFEMMIPNSQLVIWIQCAACYGCRMKQDEGHHHHHHHHITTSPSSRILLSDHITWDTIAECWVVSDKESSVQKGSKHYDIVRQPRCRFSKEGGARWFRRGDAEGRSGEEILPRFSAQIRSQVLFCKLHLRWEVASFWWETHAVGTSYACNTNLAFGCAG